MATIFYNETSYNGKVQVMTTEKLQGKGIKDFGGSNIVEHAGELYKNNLNYWMSKKAFELIKSNYNVVRVCF